MANNYQNINNFTKGLYKDYSPLNQPDNSYTNALNFVQLSGTGDYFSLTNEKGTIVNSSTIPNGYKICGEVVLENDKFIFINNPITEKSQIGVINKAGLYTRLIPSNDYLPDVSTGELDLGEIIKLENGIDVQARKLFTGDRILYWTDNEHPMGYANVDNPPLTDLKANLRFISLREQPNIDSIDLLDVASSVKSGVYQFSFRYVTKEGNILPIGIVSNPIPVGATEAYQARASALVNTSYQGAYPDALSGKQIQVNLSNIDTSFTELQILVTVYEGLNNTLKVYLWRTFTIDSTGTLTFNYDGASNEEELTLEDITSYGISYTTAKCVEQKDNRLFFSNLKDDKEKYPIQELADKVIVKYKIDEVLANNDNNYQNVETAFSKKGYMRDEVYSLGIAILYKDGSRSYAYHIPAGPSNSGFVGSSIAANFALKQPGVFVSSSTYNFDSPTGAYNTGDGIQHFKMPTLTQEPHFRNAAGTQYLDLLHLEFDYQTALTDFILAYPSFLDDVERFVFIRQSRLTTNENRSILQQGIGVEVMEAEIDLPFDSDPNDPGNSVNYKKLPLMGYFSYTTDKDKRFSATPPIPDQFYKNILCFSFDNYTGGSTADETLNTRDYIAGYSMLAFYSPESVLENTENIPVTSKIKPQLGLRSTTSFQDYIFYKFRCDIAVNGSGSNAIQVTEKSAKLWYYTDFSDRFTLSVSNQDITNSYYIPQNAEVPNIFNNPSGKYYSNVHGEAHLLLKITANFNTLSADPVRMNQRTTGTSTGTDQVLDGGIVNATLDTYLHNIYIENPSQYGGLKTADYIICGQKADPTVLDSPEDVYGGDTFVTKFAVVNKGDYRVKAFRSVSAESDYDNFQNPADGGFSALGLDLRGLMWFYVESTKNTDIRGTNGAVSFYPKVGFETALSYDPAVVSDSDFYNTQYSFENRTQLFFTNPKPGQIVRDGYFTRTIYSEQDITGIAGDTYRDIKINSFNDLPKNTGEIWDTFVYNNILFLHTPKTLWRSYVNQVTQQATSIGQVYLGTGALFSIPSQQITTEIGGYGGTVSQWAGCQTPFGYIYPDALQGKIFLLQGEGQLKEISNEGLIRYFNNNLSVFSLSALEYIDNPFNGLGLNSAFDYELKRWLLTKKVNNGSSSQFTISYNPYTNNFVSFHSYLPSGYITMDNQLFSYNNEETNIKLYTHNKGNYGNFYGVIYPSVLEFTVNRDSTSGLLDQTKVMDNLVLQMQVFDPSDNIIFPLRATADTIQLYNDKANSGVINLKYTDSYSEFPLRNQTLVKFKNNEYRINAPLDAITNSLPEFNSDNNMVNNNLDNNQLYRNRIKGKYINGILSFSNTENFKVTLNYVKSLFRVNFR